MAVDRNGIRLSVGDAVMLSLGMAVDGKRKGMVYSFDGEDIYVRMWVDGDQITVHRYGNEMERV